MAKDSIWDHPKTLNLMGVLGLDQASTVGLLEGLWHFARKRTPEGDIGRYADHVIVHGMHTDLKPSKVIPALIACGFIDTDPEYRLVVHDWADHCTFATEKVVTTRGRGFAKGHDPRRNTDTSAANAANEALRDAAKHAAEIAANAANSEHGHTVNGKLAAPNGAADHAAHAAPRASPSLPSPSHSFPEQIESPASTSEKAPGPAGAGPQVGGSSDIALGSASPDGKPPGRSDEELRAAFARQKARVNVEVNGVAP